ncbi:MAG TPA: ABC transporter ATP-binding protein [Steroidobacteraceae bacterium]|jgi:ABC-2 type transport system ATP-binding protein|nr:ABC transporter ATP-binding protein [Steroidobacteraceae bacterium]
MQPEDVPAFRLSDIHLSYDKLSVLEGLDFELASGQVVGLIGANGAGKSTLIRILLGLIEPQSGIAELAGEPAAALSAATRGRVGYVPQSSKLFAWLDGAGMLRYFGAFYPGFDLAYAEALAQRLKVSLNTSIQLLSPGQQQRLSIVRALSTRPDILILDEPMAALDPAGRLEVIEQLVAEQRQRPMSILISSHITQDLQRLCTELAVLHGGRIAMQAPLGKFQGLARVTVTGPESSLASFTFEGAHHVRAEGTSSRCFVVDANDLPVMMAQLPTDLQATPASQDLETVVSEWMR